jgi:2-hydroxychromene-2-carboxylate isomerase
MNPAQPAMLEFWFECGSPYSYLSAMRIEALAARHGVTVAWKPFLLGPIFRSFGWDSSPFVLQKEKGAYALRDLARECMKYGVPWQQPTTFPRRALLPMRVAMLGADEPWIGEYTRRTMQLNFADDRDIDTPEAVTEVLVALKLPAAQIIEAAVSDANRQRLREQTETARRRGVFGAPMFFAGDDMFWGNDRLEDALKEAASTTTESWCDG